MDNHAKAAHNLAIAADRLAYQIGESLSRGDDIIAMGTCNPSNLGYCRYCQADGSWSPKTLPECKAVSCPVPANPPHGRVMYNSVTYNSLISYECNYGYMIVGESVRRCERNKIWTGLQPICRGR